MIEAAGQKILAEMEERARLLGFDAMGVTSAHSIGSSADRLDSALKAGWHGDMDWMANSFSRRRAPQALWSDVRSIIMLGLSYAPDTNPMDNLELRDKGTISAYARHRDYHEIIKGRLKEIAGLLARRSGAEVKVFVDTAPVMEKPLAEAAGIGWQGKHSVLVSRQHGSWLFLGAIFTTAELPTSAPHTEHCGQCTRCLDVCPTNAFPAPFQLDARRCIAYLTVEHKSQIPRAFRAPMGNRIFGCDDCLAVCPWNKFAAETREARLRARSDLVSPHLEDLAGLDEAEFRKLFASSPVKRVGHARFLRNVLIAIGNANESDMVSHVEPHLRAVHPLVRGAAIWAFRRLASASQTAHMRAKMEPQERDPEVAAEWHGSLIPPLQQKAQP